MCEEEPESKHRLGEDIENGISNNLLVDAEDTGSIGNSPDDGVRSPNEECVERDGGKELASLATSRGCLRAAIDNQMPNDKDVGNTSNRVPTPLLAGIVTICSEESSQDHDEIGQDEHDNVPAINSSQQGKVKEEEWGGQAPVNITSPVYLASDEFVGIWDSVLVVLGLANVMIADTRPVGHAKVGNGGNDGDECGDDMIEAARHRDSPRHECECCR